MCAQIDELPDSQDIPAESGGGGNLVPVIIGVILAVLYLLEVLISL